MRKKPRNAIADLVGADIDSELSFTPVVSKRQAIRKDIENHTKAYRDAFLLEKKDYWLPLLPHNNYIRKLADKHSKLTPEEISRLPSVCTTPPAFNT